MVHEGDAANGLLSDDPRDGSAERPDQLGRADFVRHITTLLDSVRTQSESSVMALIGDWGSGKSSILEILRRDLAARSGVGAWLVAEFNPWSYPDPTSMQRGFFAELLTALPKEDRPQGARAKVGALAKAVSPFGKIGAIVGLDAERIIEAVGDLLVGDTSASAAKRAAEVVLREVGRPILMVIDDLDRLTPDELLAVLKLVRLVGRLPNVYYLLSYDERTLLDVLGQTPLAGNGGDDRSRAYLEKIVQVRLDMPVLRAGQRASLLNTGLKSILATNEVALSSQDESRLMEVYDAVLDQRLSTPRAITRFLGQVQAFFPPLRGEVDFVDFFMVSWLRTQEPGVYRMLQRERDALLGRSLEILSFGRDERAAKERKAFWEDALRRADVAPGEVNGVVRVLSELFPHVEVAFRVGNWYGSAVERRTPRAISDSDYFDRYVSFLVPDDDMPDSVVDDAFVLLGADGRGPALDRLVAELTTSTLRTVRKIDSYRDSKHPVPEPQLFSMYAGLAQALPEASIELFANPRRALMRSAAKCIVAMPSTIAVTAFQGAAEAPADPSFAVEALIAAHRDSMQQFPLFVPEGTDLDPVKRAATSMLQSRLEASEATSPFEPRALEGFWAWRELASEQADQWLRTKVTTGEWQLRDVVGALVTVGLVTDSQGSHEGIGSLDLEALTSAFGLDRVLDDFASDIERAEGFEDPWAVEPTADNRRAYAFFTLKSQRAEPTPHDTDSPQADTTTE